jgi:UDP-N-acetylmuramoyl-tripeptide--D-alanyl-D-alanine ligase
LGISWRFFIILGGSVLASPLFFVLASWIISPFERLMKWQLIYRAKKRVKACSKTKIIGITGSYGKTSVKEFLTALLKDSFEVISPIGTHNTLL